MQHIGTARYEVWRYTTVATIICRFKVSRGMTFSGDACFITWTRVQRNRRTKAKSLLRIRSISCKEDEATAAHFDVYNHVRLAKLIKRFECLKSLRNTCHILGICILFACFFLLNNWYRANGIFLFLLYEIFLQAHLFSLFAVKWKNIFNFMSLKEVINLTNYVKYYDVCLLRNGIVQENLHSYF